MRRIHTRIIIHIMCMFIHNARGSAYMASVPRGSESGIEDRGYWLISLSMGIQSPPLDVEDTDEQKNSPKRPLRRSRGYWRV
jgi:hypothetical protein